MRRIDAARRRWLARAAWIGAGGALPGASVLAKALAKGNDANGIGPLRPVNDARSGLPLLALPEGFHYTSFGWVGDPLDDAHGSPTPGAHDGMGVVGVDGDQIVLVRNHEITSDRGAFGPRERQYDPAAGGGTTTLRFDGRAGTLVSARVSLAGTLTNCAGGTTPWGSWLSCEEHVHEADPGSRTLSSLPRLTKHHGYVFDVDPAGSRAPEPLVALGRFRHEAAVVHAPTGVVYLTEDRDPRAGFYRFLPQRAARLDRPGRLQMLKVEGRPDLRRGLVSGDRLKAQWVDIEKPDQGNSPGSDDGLGVLHQGLAAGGSAFIRLEGCVADVDTIWFTATHGGDAGCGQLFAYEPSSSTLRQVYQSPKREILDGPDNLCLAPHGGLLIAEDGARDGELLQWLTPTGTLLPLARGDLVVDKLLPGGSTNLRRSEWAGCCFSPDGKWLFANLQHPGMSFAITGPWERLA